MSSALAFNGTCGMVSGLTLGLARRNASSCKAVFVILPVGCEENTLSESKQGRLWKCK